MKIVYRVKKMIMTHTIRGKLHFNAVAEKRASDTGEISSVKIYGSIEREGYEGLDGNIRILLIPEGMLAEPGASPKLKRGGGEIERHNVEIIYEKKIKSLKGGELVEEDELPPPPPPPPGEEVVEFKPKIPQKEVTPEEIEAGKQSIINFFMSKPTNGDMLCGPNICPDCRSVARGPIRLRCTATYCRFEKRPPGEPMAVDTSPPPVTAPEPKPESVVAVGKIKLTIKGNEIEMTREELKELRRALDELLKGE